MNEHRVIVRQSSVAIVATLLGILAQEERGDEKTRLEMSPHVQLQYRTVDANTIFDVHLICTCILRVSLCPFLKRLRREEPGSFPGQREKRLRRKHAAEEAGELQGNSSWPPSSPSPLFCLCLESPLFSGSHVKCDIFFTVRKMGSQARPAGTESGVGNLFWFVAFLGSISHYVLVTDVLEA